MMLAWKSNFDLYADIILTKSFLASHGVCPSALRICNFYCTFSGDLLWQQFLAFFLYSYEKSQFDLFKFWFTSCFHSVKVDYFIRVYVFPTLNSPSKSTNVVFVNAFRRILSFSEEHTISIKMFWDRVHPPPPNNKLFIILHLLFFRCKL